MDGRGDRTDRVCQMVEIVGDMTVGDPADGLLRGHKGQFSA
jgi:hypothetical protein